MSRPGTGIAVGSRAAAALVLGPTVVVEGVAPDDADEVVAEVTVEGGGNFLLRAPVVPDPLARVILIAGTCTKGGGAGTTS